MALPSKITGHQFAAACALAGLDCVKFAKAASVSPATVSRLKRLGEQDITDHTNILTLKSIVASLAKHGVEFTGDGVQYNRRRPGASVRERIQQALAEYRH